MAKGLDSIPNNKMNTSVNEVKCCFIKMPVFPSPLKKFAITGILKKHDNLEKTGSTIKLSVCQPWLLTKRPSIQMIKALRGPVVVH